MKTHDFVITVLLHTSGEICITDNDQNEVQLMSMPITSIPIVHIKDQAKLTDEEVAQVRLTTLHLILTKAAESVRLAMDKNVKSSTEINMNPTEGEKN